MLQLITRAGSTSFKLLLCIYPLFLAIVTGKTYITVAIAARYMLMNRSLWLFECYSWSHLEYQGYFRKYQILLIKSDQKLHQPRLRHKTPLILCQTQKTGPPGCLQWKGSDRCGRLGTNRSAERVRGRLRVAGANRIACHSFL